MARNADVDIIVLEHIRKLKKVTRKQHPKDYAKKRKAKRKKGRKDRRRR